MAMRRVTDDYFTEIQPGDRVAVSWPDKMARLYDGYGRHGVVVQVTERFLAVRGPAGYIFCLGAHHVAAGARVFKIAGEKGVASA